MDLAKADTYIIGLRLVMNRMVSRSCKLLERAWFLPRHGPGRTLGLMRNRWSSICRGATLWGLEHIDAGIDGNSASVSPQAFLPAYSPTVTSRLSRHSYGMSFSVPYDQQKHLLQDLYQDEKTGLFMAKGQMTWLLKRVRHIPWGFE